MVTNISALLKTVKNVENEARKGVRSLEQAIKGIEKEMEVSIRFAKSNYQTLGYKFVFFNFYL